MVDFNQNNNWPQQPAPQQPAPVGPYQTPGYGESYAPPPQQQQPMVIPGMWGSPDTTYTPPPPQDYSAAAMGAADGSGGVGGGGGRGSQFPYQMDPSSSLGLKHLKAIAQQDESPWLKLSMQRQRAAEGQAVNQLGTDSAARQAGAMGNMAMRGGLSSGATERAGQAASREQMMGGQNIYAQGLQGRLGLRAQDESFRQAALQPLMNAELGTQKFNVNQQNMAEAAKRQADAIRASGGGGGGGGYGNLDLNQLNPLTWLNQVI